MQAAASELKKKPTKPSQVKKLQYSYWPLEAVSKREPIPIESYG